jgi:hypothetical protein
MLQQQMLRLRNRAAYDTAAPKSSGSWQQQMVAVVVSWKRRYGSKALLVEMKL